jgi:hypothetical protein
VDLWAGLAPPRCDLSFPASFIFSFYLFPSFLF